MCLVCSELLPRSVQSVNAYESSDVVDLLQWELVALWVERLLVLWGVLSGGSRELFCGRVGGTSKFV